MIFFIRNLFIFCDSCRRLFSHLVNESIKKIFIIELYLTLGLDLLTDCGCSWNLCWPILVQVERINFYTTSNKNLYSVKVSPTLPSIRKHHPTESELPLQNYANENSCQSTSLPLVSLSINLACDGAPTTRERSWEVCEALRTSLWLAECSLMKFRVDFVSSRRFVQNSPPTPTQSHMSAASRMAVGSHFWLLFFKLRAHRGQFLN